MFKSGFVSVIGRPNVGKSTLLNSLLGKKISIVSHKPQTTRNRILGIIHKDESQIILMDSPGFFLPKKIMDTRLVTTAKKTLKEGDVVLFVVDASHEAKYIIKSFDFLEHTSVPIILVLNKIDLVPKEDLLPLIGRFSEVGIFKDIVPVSALKEENLDTLIKILDGYISEGPKYFPEDKDTDQAESFLIAEIIREKVFRFTHKEVPYSSFVEVDDIKERKKLLEIYATVFVEKESQKPIVVGAKGKMMKVIGEQARKEIESILGTKVYLKLWVKVKNNWRMDQKRVDRLVY